MMVTLSTLICPYCQIPWIPRIASPKRCPSCFRLLHRTRLVQNGRTYVQAWSTVSQSVHHDPEPVLVSSPSLVVFHGLMPLSDADPMSIDCPIIKPE